MVFTSGLKGKFESLTEWLSWMTLPNAARPSSKSVSKSHHAGGEVVAVLVVVDATGPAERERVQQAGLSVEGLLTLRDLGVNPNIQLDASSQA
jgi:hypothetical protein